MAARSINVTVISDLYSNMGNMNNPLLKPPEGVAKLALVQTKIVEVVANHTSARNLILKADEPIVMH